MNVCKLILTLLTSNHRT